MRLTLHRACSRRLNPPAFSRSVVQFRDSNTQSAKTWLDNRVWRHFKLRALYVVASVLGPSLQDYEPILFMSRMLRFK